MPDRQGEELLFGEAGDPAAIEIETDVPDDGDPTTDTDGAGSGDLFGDGGGGGEPPGRKRRPSPFRGPLHWIDLTIPPPLVFWCQAWVAAHADLPARDPQSGRERPLVDLPLEAQWDVYLRDVTARDIQADLDRPPAARQYDWAQWFRSAVPPHLTPDPEIAAGRPGPGEALRGLFVDTLRRLRAGQVRLDDLDLVIQQLEEG